MNAKIREYSSLVEEKLYKYFEVSLPQYKTLFDSMEYSVKNGGKRVRPLLTLLFYNACGKDDVLKAMPMAEAVEFIHTYSLIHDDLPCMDNDDFRRGKPSNHKVYGEAVALLAGDGLLTAAFERISSWSLAGLYDAETAVKAINELSVYAGSRGMIGGQIIDIGNENNPDADFDTLQLMDSLKTGCLISVACALGCIVAGASDDLVNSAKIFGEKLGLAFQIKDDILDVTSSLEKLGKMTGSDKVNNKSTYVTLLGVEKCEELVKTLTAEAMESLNVFPNNGLIKEYADYLQNREY
ncbi:MAG: polyprenyl synthetase family protein [Clostridia bacterium]|nr:polyprenyl synthetase family protein [Clostridia bacterium]